MQIFQARGGAVRHWAGVGTKDQQRWTGLAKIRRPESAPAPEPLFPPPPPALPAPVDARYLPAPETTREFASPAQSFSPYEIWSNAFSEPIEAQQKLVPQPPPPGLFRRMGDATRNMFDRSEDQIDQPVLEDDPLDRPEPAPFGHSFPMGRQRAGIRNDRSRNDNYVVLGSPEMPGIALAKSKRMNDLDHRSGRPMISLPSMQALRQDAHIAVRP